MWDLKHHSICLTCMSIEQLMSCFKKKFKIFRITTVLNKQQHSMDNQWRVFLRGVIFEVLVVPGHILGCEDQGRVIPKPETTLIRSAANQSISSHKGSIWYETPSQSLEIADLNKAGIKGALDMP